MILASKKPPSPQRHLPKVLVVDDEPDMLELIRDVVDRAGNCRLVTASNVAQAEKIIRDGQVDLLVADVHLPDGNGMSLLSQLRESHPAAATVVITGEPTITGAVSAFREGVVDFLPKPFSADMLLERMNNALKRQATSARKEVRLTRLKGAVKKLNVTRHLISKKVDLLCNDLVSAYGELSRQFDTVRRQESFRKLLSEAADLEQLLCHAMDWILRNAGYCNVAIWMASEEKEFELGAYMKYSIPGDPELTSAMRVGLLPLIAREGTIHLFGAEAKEQLTPAELKLLAGQEIIGHNCTYLGESLAAVVMFRDEKAPFTDDDVAMLRAICPIFAAALTSVIRDAQGHDGNDDDEDRESNHGPDGGALMDDETESKKPRPKNDADWWKHGEAPPF